MIWTLAINPATRKGVTLAGCAMTPELAIVLDPAKPVRDAYRMAHYPIR